MGILRAPCALALMALVGLAGCQTGKSWLSSSKPTPSRDAAALAKSDYPVPPSKTAAPPSLNPSGGRTGGLSSATHTPGLGSTSGGTVSGGKYGTSAATYNALANSGGATPGSSLGSRAPSTAGSAIATDPFPTGPQRGRYSPLAGTTADTRTLSAGTGYPSGGATYPNTGYGSTPSIASRPSYTAGPAASGGSPAGTDTGSSLYQPLRSRAASGASPLAGDRTADPLYAGGTSGGSASLGSRDYVPGATGYNPGSTGYNPPTGNYTPGSTGYNPPGIPQDRPSTGNGYYQPAPAGSGDDPPPYRPGGTSDILRRSGTTSPIAGTSSSDPLGTAGRRSDFDVAPVGYDAQPDTTLRR